MPISDAASLVGGAALGAPVSVIFNLLIEQVKNVKDFKPLFEDLLSTMERLVPIINEIESMPQGSGPGDLNFLFKTMDRAEDMVSKCSRVQWYSIAEKALYTKKIKGINQDFLKFCQLDLQLIQLKYLKHSTTKNDTSSEGSAELFVVPQPETVTLFWLFRPLMELKKMLLEDQVVTIVVSASSACGKTMLVTKLCLDADVKGKFKHIFFIAVSKAPNVRLIIQRFLQHTGREAKEFADAKLCIQQLLQQLGESGPILLVLDDVWPEDESLLDKFLIQLPDYKILVTSRSEFLRFGPTYYLEPSIDEDVNKLFMDCTPQPNCLTCAKRNDLLLKIGDRCKFLIPTANPPCSCRTENREASILRDLDQTAGKWPLELAKEFGALAVKCSSVNRGGNMDFSTKEIMQELGKIMEKANEFSIKGGYEEATNSNMDEADPNGIPCGFLCPILQEVMKNPHVAADGFSYELEAIEEWLRMGHDTSPMTNLRLDYQVLTPNYTLRVLIQDWHSKRVAQASS